MLDLSDPATYNLACSIWHHAWRRHPWLARHSGSYMDFRQDFFAKLLRYQRSASAYNPSRSSIKTYLYLVASTFIRCDLASRTMADRSVLGVGEDAALWVSGNPTWQEARKVEVSAELARVLPLLSRRQALALDESLVHGLALRTRAERNALTSAERVLRRCGLPRPASPPAR